MASPKEVTAVEEKKPTGGGGEGNTAGHKSKKREKEVDGFTVFRQMAAGSLARATSGALLIPIDTCKTRLQFQGSMALGEVKKYDGFIHCFKSIYKEESVGAFYRGLPARLLYIVPAAGVSFAVYEWAKRLVVSEESHTKLQIAMPFVVGSFARLMATTVKIPFDVVKQRLEVQGAILKKTQENVYSGTFDAFRKILAREGIAKGLWSGYAITILRDIPFSVTYFSSYEVSKYYQKVILESLGLLGNHDLNTANHLVAGATAGCVASFVTLPIDTVKTRVQTEGLTLKKTFGGAPTNQAPAVPRSNIFSIAKGIYHTEGVRGFYRGLVPRLISIIPSASITFAAYEAYKKLFGI